MCRHDEDLVGPSLLQRLRRRHETVHVVDDVILWNEQLVNTTSLPNQSRWTSGRPNENLTTMMAMRPPTSPTTVIGGFSFGISTADTKRYLRYVTMDMDQQLDNVIRTGALQGISMLGWMAPVVLTVGGECRPSTWSDSAS